MSARPASIRVHFTRSWPRIIRLCLMSKLSVREEDIVEKFLRSRGPGGQNVNKVSTCVYLRHLPTGIEVKCQEERSQAANRLRAREILLDKIEERMCERVREEKSRLARRRRKNRKRSPAQKENILRRKHRHSEKKILRKKIRDYDY